MVAGDDDAEADVARFVGVVRVALVVVAAAVDVATTAARFREVSAIGVARELNAKNQLSVHRLFDLLSTKKNQQQQQQHKTITHSNIGNCRTTTIPSAAAAAFDAAAVLVCCTQLARNEPMRPSSSPCDRQPVGGLVSVG